MAYFPLFRSAVGAFLTLCVFGPAVLLAQRAADCVPSHRPVVMIHGFLASGDTWSRFCRAFARAGYCPEHLYAFDWNTLQPQANHTSALDAAIDTLLARTGARQVDLIAHSAGGGLAYRYLSDSLRATKVARYVHIGSGRQAQPAGPPDQIPMLNLWSDDDIIARGGEIAGAVNRMLPGLDHYQVATHPDVFREVFRFLNDSIPVSKAKARRSFVSLSGRAVFFGDNQPAAHATIELYALDSLSGERLSALPAAQTQADARGYWHIDGIPVDQPTEIVVQPSKGGRPVHYFFSGFDEDHPLLYLRVLPRGMSMVSQLLASLPDTSAQTVWNIYLSDQAVLAGRDSLTVNGVVLSSPLLAPPEKTAISFFLFDENGNGQTDGTALKRFARFPFLSGADVFLSPHERSAVAVYFNGRRQHVRRIPADQGVQVVVF